MTNSQLAEDLLAKIPVSMRMQWGMVAASLGQEEPNLGDLSRWLEDIAVAASYVTTSSTLVREPVKEKQKYEHQLRNL